MNPRFPFTRAGFNYGLVRSWSLVPSVLIYGAVFGILASEARLDVVEAILMSVFVYSGSAQIAAVQILKQGSDLLPLATTILLLNARYLLYGATLRPWLEGQSYLASYGTLFFLGDGNWALAMAERSRGQRDAAIILGSGVTMFAAWIAGTILGRVFGTFIGDPVAYGLDFMLVAFSASFLISLWRGAAMLGPVVAASLVCAVFTPVLPSGWIIVAASLAAATIGFALADESDSEDGAEDVR